MVLPAQRALLHNNFFWGNLGCWGISTFDFAQAVEQAMDGTVWMTSWVLTEYGYGYEILFTSTWYVLRMVDIAWLVGSWE